MFKEERRELMFDWSMLGDIGEGRPNLGMTMNVASSSILSRLSTKEAGEKITR